MISQTEETFNRFFNLIPKKLGRCVKHKLKTAMIYKSFFTCVQLNTAEGTEEIHTALILLMKYHFRDF